MELYTNILPIDFGNGGILVSQKSFSTTGKSTFQGNIWNFEKGGVVYEVPILEALSISSKIEIIKPIIVPELATALVRFGLTKELGKVGEVTSETINGFDFQPHDTLNSAGSETLFFRFSVHILPGSKAPLFLSVKTYQLDGQNPLRGINDFRMVRRLAKTLSGQAVVLQGGNSFQLKSPFDGPAPATRQLVEPPLLFLRNGMAPQEDPATGIAKNGPYSSEVFRQSTFHVLVIGRNENRGSLTRFLGELKNGLPNVSNGAIYPWRLGWQESYHFADLETHACFVNTNDKVTIAHEIQKAVERAKGKRIQFDMAFFEVDSEETVLHPSSDPYCHIKANLLKYGIASQAITLDTLRLEDFERANAIAKVALKSYAKAGGTPWRMRVEQDLEHEVIAGVGVTDLNDSFYGFSTFFSSEGQYLLGNSSIRGSIDDWEASLSELITRQINEIAKKDNWTPGSNVRLVFHFSRQLAPNVLDDLDSALRQSLEKYEVFIAYLLIEESVKFSLWDKNQKGWNGKQGVYQPKRGTFCKISEELALVQFAKIADHKVFAPPLALRLMGNSNHTDLDHMALQAFNFSRMSWQRLGHGLLPATLEYGNAITTLLEKFRQAGYEDDISTALTLQTHQTWFL